jgi:hypothetical protein
MVKACDCREAISRRIHKGEAKTLLRVIKDVRPGCR